MPQGRTVLAPPQELEPFEDVFDDAHIPQRLVDSYHANLANLSPADHFDQLYFDALGLEVPSAIGVGSHFICVERDETAGARKVFLGLGVYVAPEVSSSIVDGQTGMRDYTEPATRATVAAANQDLTENGASQVRVSWHVPALVLRFASGGEPVVLLDNFAEGKGSASMMENFESRFGVRVQTGVANDRVNDKTPYLGDYAPDGRYYERYGVHMHTASILGLDRHDRGLSNQAVEAYGTTVPYMRRIACDIGLGRTGETKLFRDVAELKLAKGLYGRLNWRQIKNAAKVIRMMTPNSGGTITKNAK